MKAFVLIIILLAGCAKPIDGEVTHEFDQYLHDFNSDLMKLGYMPIDFSQTTILIGEVPYGAEATCDGRKLQRQGFAVITIRRESLSQQEYLKKSTIYHEVGHCFLGLDHDSVDNVSIMNESKNIVYHPEYMNQESLRLSLVSDMVSASGYIHISIFPLR